MSRQHATPVLLPASGETVALQPLSFDGGPGQVSEADIQALVHAYPQCLPIAEIDSAFVGAVPICTELRTNAGAIDNFLVTPGGMPVLVECKLWRNPEGRRKVVGQILDYAKELSRWSSADIHREVAVRTDREDGPLLQILREAGHEINEIAFNDALTQNLRRGRFLLLIVGDGIREGVEAIAEYLQRHAGAHFSLGLVEMPIYLAPDGARLVVPRVLARTHLIERHVIVAPDDMIVVDPQEPTAAREIDPDAAAMAAERQQFWTDFQERLVLDDLEQPVGKPPRMGYTTLSMPVPRGVSWLTVYRDMSLGEVGIFLSYHHDTLGERVAHAIAEDRDVVLDELGGTAQFIDNKGKPRLIDKLRVGPLNDPANREAALAWLRARTNDFVNILRPRIRALALDLAGEA
ncbi:hypothetical protein ACCC88_20945 [Sphingomonas sp. Sphisp140]|uniref:hypothetical protein n=1 Tax=unclassified Sphingomonas TaxID=196159 RepID=UPI0039AEB5CB